MAQSFRDLQIWQKAMQLTVAIYGLTARFPKEEMYGLTGQLRRAAVSVPSNIAEGHGRLSNREFTQFLSVARGSICELQTQLDIARSLGFGEVKAIDEAEHLSHEVGKMIFAFLGSLKNQPSRKLSSLHH
ncbi:MAG: four helix bundle protein [Terracidiphilus sp.]